MHDIAGYRIVRRLASTLREDRVIARGDSGGVLVRRVLHPVPEAVDRAVEAHGAVTGHPHIVALLDLALELDGSLVVVTDLVAGPTLREHLLTHTASWRLGHAVTALFPIITTVADLHDAGVTLGALGLDDIRLSASGAPIIVTLTDAVLTAPLPERLREQDPHYAADRSALLDLAELLVAALADPEERASLMGVIRQAEGASGRTFADRVFALAEPLPLRDEASQDVSPDGGATAREQLVLPFQVSASPVLSARDRADSMPAAVVSAGRAVGLPSSILGPLQEGIEAAQKVFCSVREKAGCLSRGRVMLVAAAVAVFLALGVTTVLDGQREPGSPASGETREEPQAVPDPLGAPAVALDVADASPLTSAEPADDEWAEISSILVGEWGRCAQAAERLCETALHRESAAATARLHGEDTKDVAMLADAIAASAEVFVEERMGAAVIVRVSGPETTAASLLLMRSEAGWRIRDVLD